MSVSNKIFLEHPKDRGHLDQMRHQAMDLLRVEVDLEEQLNFDHLF